MEGSFIMTKKERVILIKGGASKWYEQAIFIVNQDAPQETIPVDFISEAENIIRHYSEKKTGNIGVAYAPVPVKQVFKSRRKKTGLDYVLNAVMALGCIAIAVVLLMGIL